MPRSGALTTSHHHQGNLRKAENTVKTVKRLFYKCQEASQSEFKALLDWRNTPTEGVGTSPAQRFLGRRCNTWLPMTEALLKPKYSTVEDAQALFGQKNTLLQPAGPGPATNCGRRHCSYAPAWAIHMDQSALYRPSRPMKLRGEGGRGRIPPKS